MERLAFTDFRDIFGWETLTGSAGTQQPEPACDHIRIDSYAPVRYVCRKVHKPGRMITPLMMASWPNYFNTAPQNGGATVDPPWHSGAIELVEHPAHAL